MVDILEFLRLPGTIKKCSVLCMTFEELPTSQVGKKTDCIYLSLITTTSHNKVF